MAELSTYDGEAGADQLDAVLPIYAACYAEPPYLEGPDDVADFAEQWPWCVSRAGFRLVTADVDGHTIGFAFGFTLPPDTGWWSGLLDPADPALTTEQPGRTFALIELAVLAAHRKRGIGRALHDQVLRDRAEHRVTLTVRPEATAAVEMYRAWDYTPVGRTRPAPGLPVYLAMLRAI